MDARVIVVAVDFVGRAFGVEQTGYVVFEFHMPFDPLLEWQNTGLSSWSLAAAAVLLLVLLSWFVGWLRKRRRGQAILTALRASSRGRIEFRRGPGAWGFVSAVTPPPD